MLSWDGGECVYTIRIRLTNVNMTNKNSYTVFLKPPKEKAKSLKYRLEDDIITPKSLLVADVHINDITTEGMYEIAVRITNSEGKIYVTRPRSILLCSSPQLLFCKNCRYLKDYTSCIIFDKDIKAIFWNIDDLFKLLSEKFKDKPYYELLMKKSHGIICPMLDMSLPLLCEIENDLEVFPTIKTKIGMLIL